MAQVENKREKKNVHCLKRPWAATSKAKHFSCRQENAGELARDELVRKYLLPVDAPSILLLWPTRIADNTADKTLSRTHGLGQLPSAVLSTPLTHAGPSGSLPKVEDVQINQQERFGMEI